MRRKGMTAFEEFIAAMRQELCQQLAIRWRNDGIVSSGKNEHRGLDVGVPSLVLRSDTTHFSSRYSEVSAARS